MHPTSRLLAPLMGGLNAVMYDIARTVHFRLQVATESAWLGAKDCSMVTIEAQGCCGPVCEQIRDAHGAGYFDLPSTTILATLAALCDGESVWEDDWEPSDDLIGALLAKVGPPPESWLAKRREGRI